MTLNMVESDLPNDISPDVTSTDFDPAYPGSTADAPYGFKPDGTPYRRRPRGSGTKKSFSSSTLPASEKSARNAAGLLARANGMLGFALMSLGMPLTATQLIESNDQFENMAYESLLTDPALCRKILSAGATSGKTGLTLAYAMLGASVAPTALGEIKARRKESEDAE